MHPKKQKNHRQRLKERFIETEKSALSEEMLLELLLTYSIPRKDVQTIAKALITKFNGISGVLNASFEELSNMKGIGQNSGILIKLIDAIQSQIASQPEPEKPEDHIQIGPKQRFFFEPDEKKEKNRKVSKPSEKPIKPFRKRGIKLFANALMKETISVLPDLPDSDSVDTARQTIQGNLHFSAETTRSRNSLYIVQRLFPNGFVDRPLRLFANHFRTRDELNEVCFYRFLGAEPLLGKSIDELIIPNIGVGYIGRERIKDFLEKLFPESKSIKHGTKAILDALIFG